MPDAEVNPKAYPLADQVLLASHWWIIKILASYCLIFILLGSHSQDPQPGAAGHQLQAAEEGSQRGHQDSQQGPGNTLLAIISTPNTRLALNIIPVALLSLGNTPNTCLLLVIVNSPSSSSWPRTPSRWRSCCTSLCSARTRTCPTCSSGPSRPWAAPVGSADQSSLPGKQTFIFFQITKCKYFQCDSERGLSDQASDSDHPAGD